MSYHRVLPCPVALSDEDLANRWAVPPDSLRAAKIMTNEKSRNAYQKNGQIPASSSSEPVSKGVLAAVGEQQKSSPTGEESKPELGRRDSTSGTVRKTAPSNLETWQGDIPSQICLCQPDPKVPRPRNAFILYRQHHQASIVAQHPGLPNPEISKVIGDHWRASPPEVKEHWKLLAEEEKIRHQKQHPDYRYQPRRTGRAGSVADHTHGGQSVAEASRCAKCGGKSISSSNVMNTGASTPAQASPPISQPSSRGGSHSMPPPPGTSNSTTGRFARHPGSPPVKDGSMYGYRFARSQTAHGLPLASPKYPKRQSDDIMSPTSPSSKRRRMPTVVFAQTRGPQGPATPFALAQSQQRRPSLPRPDFMGGSLPSPSVTTLPPRTPNSQVQPRSDSLRLPPLHTGPTAHTHARSGSNDMQQARTLEAMVHSIPILNKIRVLGKISGPLPKVQLLGRISTPVSLMPSPDSPVSFERRKGRGPVIAIDSADDDALKQLTEALKRNLKNDYDLKVFATPELPEDETTTLQSYLRLIDKFHDLSREVTDHVCPPNTAIEVPEPEMTGVARKVSAAGRQLSTVELAPADEREEDAMDVSSESTLSPKSFPNKERATRKMSHMDAIAETDAATHEQDDTPMPKQRDRKLPVAIVPAWQLTHTDSFSTKIPITDLYSPHDHWQWHATIWRGVVGADATIAVQTMLSEELQPHSPPHTARSLVSNDGSGSVTDARKGALKGNISGKGDKSAGGGADIRLEDARAVIIQAGEKGSVGESALRRVGFELGEWVRGWSEREDA